MDMWDFFFPEIMQATHLRQVARSLQTRRPSGGARQSSGEVQDLREDVRFLSLVLAAILKRLSENETMSLTDVTDLLGEIDKLDGLDDAGLDPGVLRGLLGVVKQESAQSPNEDSEQINIDATPWRPHRYRKG